MKNKNIQAQKTDEQIEKEAREEVVKALKENENTLKEEYENVSTKLVNDKDGLDHYFNSSINHAIVLNAGAVTAVYSVSYPIASIRYIILGLCIGGLILSIISLLLASRSRSLYKKFLGLEKDCYKGMIYLNQKEIEDETFKIENSNCYRKTSENFKQRNKELKSYKRNIKILNYALFGSYALFVIALFYGFYKFYLNSITKQTFFSDFSFWC